MAELIDAALAGRRALVTGGGTGIGRALASALVTAGVEVAICGRRRAPLVETAKQLRQIGEARWFMCDLSDPEATKQLGKEIGSIDVLVNNAGYAILEPWTEVSVAHWREVMTVNVEAPMRLAQVFVPAMVANHWGRVVNISSVYGSLAPDEAKYPGIGRDIASYVTSKHALLGLTKHLAVMVGRTGVTVNAISPGMIPGTHPPPLPRAAQDALAAGTPVGRTGRPEELCSALLFLVSPASAFVTGQNVVVDGGWSVW